MSINALSPNRFTPQQARLNNQAAQQRQGVTFPEEATIAALETFGQIVQVVALDGATKYDYGLLYHVKQGLKALIGNQEDRFTGGVEVIPDLDKPHLSIMRVSLQREIPHLGEGAEPLTHRVELSPTSASDAVENDFKNALGFVRGTEREIADQRFEAEIRSKVPDATRQEIRKDAEALFGDGASGDGFYPGLDFT
jgi:hypothetical protein